MNPQRVRALSACPIPAVFLPGFLALLVLAAPARAEVPPMYISSWGSRGSGPGQFYNPSGILMGPDGNVYVGDHGNSRVQRFTADGVYLGQWPVGDPTDGRFHGARTLVRGPEGHICVVDQDRGRILMYTTDGTFLSAWGDSGTAPGQLLWPSGLAFGPNGHAYVACTLTGIQEFLPDGTFIRRFDRVTPDGHQYNAIFLAVDAAGNVYATDNWPYPGNDRVLVFSADGTYLREWGSRGTGDGQFADPNGIAVDSVGNVYVTERDVWSWAAGPPVANNRIQKFTATGILLQKWGGAGTTPGLFNWPEQVALAPGGILYVTDSYNQRVQKFGPATNAVKLGSILAGVQGGSVRLEWSAYTDGPATFQVLRSQARSGGYAAVSGDLQGSSDRTGYSYLDASTRPSSEYFYKVAWRDATGTGESGPVRVSTPAAVLALRSVGPNPATGPVRVDFELARAGRARLEVLDVTGRRVRTLLDSDREAGPAWATWDGLGEGGGRLASGLYFVRFTAEGRAFSRRVTLTR